jgi:hypothetical protein
MCSCNLTVRARQLSCCEKGEGLEGGLMRRGDIGVLGKQRDGQVKHCNGVMEGVWLESGWAVSAVPVKKEWS